MTKFIGLTGLAIGLFVLFAGFPTAAVVLLIAGLLIAWAGE